MKVFGPFGDLQKTFKYPQKLPKFSDQEDKYLFICFTMESHWGVGRTANILNKIADWNAPVEANHRVAMDLIAWQKLVFHLQLKCGNNHLKWLH